MKYAPIGNLVVLQPLETEQKSESGIYLGDGAQSNVKRGLVLEVGPGLSSSGWLAARPQVQEGDYVRYRGDSGVLLEQDVLILDATAVLAVEKKDNEPSGEY